MIETINANCLDVLKQTAANSQDLIFCDPPYALGSDVIIRKDGKPDYRKAVDFMSKWQQPDGYFWEQWFNEAFRVLRYGGRVVMFGMDRQLMLNKYYACFAGFAEQQSLYWYFISNFPKASDLGKMLDKNAGANTDALDLKYQFRQYLRLRLLESGSKQSDINKLLGTQMAGHYFGESQPAIPTIEHYEKLKAFLNLSDEYDFLIYERPKDTIEAEREVIGEKKGTNQDSIAYGKFNDKVIDITTPATTLAQKYNGMKYSIAPLKQTNETILVFQKPYKTGSCLHDTLAYENGDNTCMCGAVDVEGNRCGTSSGDLSQMKAKEHKNSFDIENANVAFVLKRDYETNTNGRYPAQTYLDDEAAKVLDGQSGISKSDSVNGVTDCKLGTTSTLRRNDTGGCSRILHRCNYDLNDYDIYHYCPKVSNKERNEGCGILESKRASHFGYDLGLGNAGEGMFKDRNPIKNNTHPTVKPIALLKKIIALFKTPNELHVLDPFMGSGSMGIACIELGVSYTGVELDAEYYTIAQTRLAHHNTKNNSKLF